MKGTVTRYDKTNGYGFILGSNGQSYFVHQTMILMNGFRCLKVDQQVKFEPSSSEKGLEAHNVEVLENKEG